MSYGPMSLLLSIEYKFRYNGWTSNHVSTFSMFDFVFMFRLFHLLFTFNNINLILYVYTAHLYHMVRANNLIDNLAAIESKLYVPIKTYLYWTWYQICHSPFQSLTGMKTSQQIIKLCKLTRRCMTMPETAKKNVRYNDLPANRLCRNTLMYVYIHMVTPLENFLQG